jgi:hypothetical protein
MAFWYSGPVVVSGCAPSLVLVDVDGPAVAVCLGFELSAYK